MYKIYLSFILLLASMSSFGQLDRTKAPLPAVAKKIELGSSQYFMLPNGLNVIVVEDHSRPIISFSIKLVNTFFTEGELAGNSSLAGSLMMSGTKNRTKEQIDQQIDILGASITSNSDGLTGMTLSKYNEKVFDILSDIILNPTFPSEELEKEKLRQITGLMNDKEEPATISSHILSTVLYGSNHPYGEIMSPESVTKITRESCLQFYNSYFRPNNAYLILVGDITVNQATSLSSKYLGTWERKKIKIDKYTFPKALDNNIVAISNKADATQTNIRLAYTLNLNQSNPDRLKVAVLNEVLGGSTFSSRLMSNLREKHGYTYGAYSSVQPNENVAQFSAGAKVRTSVTDSAFVQIICEMQSLQVDTVPIKTLQLIKNSMAGSFGRALERPETLANFAYNIKRFNLPADYYSTYLQRLDAVSQTDVKEMAIKYLKPENAVLVAVGDSSTIAPILKKLVANSDVQFYNFEGKRIGK